MSGNLTRMADLGNVPRQEKKFKVRKQKKYIGRLRRYRASSRTSTAIVAKAIVGILSMTSMKQIRRWCAIPRVTVPCCVYFVPCFFSSAHSSGNVCVFVGRYSTPRLWDGGSCCFLSRHLHVLLACFFFSCAPRCTLRPYPPLEERSVITVPCCFCFVPCFRREAKKSKTRGSGSRDVLPNCTRGPPVSPAWGLKKLHAT